MAKDIMLKVTDLELQTIGHALYDSGRALRSMADRCYPYITQAKRNKMYDDAWKQEELRSKLYKQVKDNG